jgi:DNA-binding HxlR family transcriptional regulator
LFDKEVDCNLCYKSLFSNYYSLGVNTLKVRGDYTCPLELTHDITKGKWKPIILWQLRLGNTSLASLEKNIQGINQKMLIEHIKELLDCGMINKNVFEGYPLKVEYFLTQRGEKMIEAITIMQHIGIELMRENGMEDVLKAKGFID